MPNIAQDTWRLLTQAPAFAKGDADGLPVPGGVGGAGHGAAGRWYRAYGGAQGRTGGRKQRRHRAGAAGWVPRFPKLLG